MHLGTDAGDTATGLTASTGTVLLWPAIAADTSTLYGTFSNGWRVTSADSLFTYGTGRAMLPRGAVHGCGCLLLPPGSTTKLAEPL